MKEDALRSLIHSLTPAETKAFRKLLDQTTGGKKALSYRAFILLADPAHREKTDAELSELLYQEKKAISAFRMLKSRLNARLMEFKISDENLENLEYLDERTRDFIRMRKKLLEYLVLIRTNSEIQYSSDILEEVIIHSKKYEHYSVLIEALNNKKLLIASRKSEKMLIKVQNEIEFYEKSRRALLLAENMHAFYINRINRTTTDIDKNIIELLKSFIIQLKAVYSKTKSNQVLSQLLEFEKVYFILLKKYPEAILKVKTFQKVFKNKPFIFLKQEIGGSYLDLSQLEIYLGKYRLGLKIILESRKYYPALSSNYYFTKCIEFGAHFYLKDFAKAKAASDLLISCKPKTLGVEWEGRFHLNHSNALFALGKYHECLQSMRKNSALTEDKTGLDLGQRMLLILCFVELNQPDAATAAIEAMRKQLERNEGKRHIRKRDKVIYRVLHALSRNSFDFKKTRISQVENLNLLKNKKGDHAWEHFTHELIKFHEWVLEHE